MMSRNDPKLRYFTLATAVVGGLPTMAVADCGLQIETVAVNITASSPGVTIFDLPLSGPIPVSSVPQAGFDAWRITHSGSGLTSVHVQLLFDGAPVTDAVETWSFNGSTDAITFTDNLAVPIPADVEAVDSIRFRINHGQSGMSTTLTGIFPDSIIRVLFSPASASVSQLVLPEWSGPVTVVNNGTTAWQTVELDVPVTASTLRIAVLLGFASFNTSGTEFSASVEAQLLLDDGSTLGLEDWWSPPQGNAPLAEDHWFSLRAFLLLDSESSGPLAGTSIVGVRRRFHSSGEGSMTWTFNESILRLISGPASSDIDSDGLVGVDDLILIILAWGDSGGFADVNADGVVDVDDLVQVVTDWGSCTE